MFLWPLAAVGSGVRSPRARLRQPVRLGLSVTDVVNPSEVPAAPGADVLLLAGSFEQDVAAIRGLRSRPAAIGPEVLELLLMSSAAAPRASLHPRSGRRVCALWPTLARPKHTSCGRCGPITPSLSVGAGLGHVDYPAAQAYACGLLALHCATVADCLDDEALAATARKLRWHYLLRAVRAWRRRPLTRPPGCGCSMALRGQTSRVATSERRGGHDHLIEQLSEKAGSSVRNCEGPARPARAVTAQRRTSTAVLVVLLLGGFVVGVLTGGVVGDVDDAGDFGDRFFDGVFDALGQCHRGHAAALAASAQSQVGNPSLDRHQFGDAAVCRDGGLICLSSTCTTCCSSGR